MDFFKMITNFNANQYIGMIIIILVIVGIFYALIDLIMTKIKEIKTSNKKG